MVFANLPAHEKDAFFTLLDEYFESRPELFSAVGTAAPGSEDPRTAAASIVGRAIVNNPAAAAKFGSRALAASQASKPPSQTAEPGASEQQDNLRSAFGRVSAASSAFANRGQDASAGAPPAPPSRANSSGSAGPPPAAPPRRSPSQKPESTVSGLVSRQTMATTTRAPAAPAVPAAFPARKTTMPPPPTRRVPSSDSVSSPPPSAPARRAAPEPEPEAEPEFSGEWADVLYDYSSTDPGDLNVKEGQQILITDRTSDDWWTAELNNKTGLVPASYVKVL
ncbi:hypothetical protein BDV98DRAFT_569304 [Pterulicium gracile]|uniref:SH3 domain-containing protein n=1 Tax=Pterulicium gracile TaxID=1884261 RepID=A0A5C3QQJ1_9AGAR|nr:hypothetical protein BDV98DRAFT_569304 [Pterula gracilis]